jgi:hypothetical protein
MQVTIPQVTVNVPGPVEMVRSWRWTLLAALVLVLTLAGGASPASAAESITSPDTGGLVGEYTSLALDALGYPVVSYQEGSNGDLKVLHCNDANCVGVGESIASPQFGGAFDTSIALDAAGNPVVSYRSLANDLVNFELRLLHCNDANCVGGDDSVTAHDTGGTVGAGNSLELDANGYPVVSYFHQTSGDLKLLHCNDANCAGGGESITSPDTAGLVGQYTSLTLDAAGNPVVSYYDATNGDLKVMHCNDANCSGGGESITSPDTGVGVGEYTSLALDASGNPVVSYRDLPNLDLKVLHCNDANCAGGGESITSPDTGGSVGEYTWLALDAAGRPVVSYYDATNGNLKLMHCNEANCSGGGESITSPDTLGTVGRYTSLALDTSGNPVVSYYDDTNADLRIMHCNDPNCSSSAKQTAIDITNLGQYALPKTCFEVRDAAQVALFEVCDNDFAGVPAAHVACIPDGVCNDEDSADGSVRVVVNGAGHRVVQSQPAPEHTGDASKYSCSTPIGGEGAVCELTFLNTPKTDPWYPWDVDGNGVVDLFNDIFGVAAHFGCGKGPVGEVCP